MFKIRSRKDIKADLASVKTTMERSNDPRERKEIANTIAIIEKFLETGTLSFNVRIEDKYVCKA